MSSSATTKSPLRIVVGSDNAGHAYKTALKETLRKHAGVASVSDVGVNGADDDTAYPHLAVDAAKKIKNGEVCLSPILILPCLACLPIYLSIYVGVFFCLVCFWSFFSGV